MLLSRTQTLGISFAPLKNSQEMPEQLVCSQTYGTKLTFVLFVRAVGSPVESLSSPFFPINKKPRLFAGA